MTSAPTGLRCFTIDEIPRDVRERFRAAAKKLVNQARPEERLLMELRIDQIVEKPGLAAGPHYISRAAWEAVLGPP